MKQKQSGKDKSVRVKGPLGPRKPNAKGNKPRTRPQAAAHNRVKAPMTAEPVSVQHHESEEELSAPMLTSFGGALSQLQRKMQSKLHAGQFRFINESLYTCSGDKAQQLFKKDPSLFDAYHEGFREQVNKWPQNPVDIFIRDVKRHPKWIVGDFGCGDAKLAASVPNKVYSFDLVAANSRVTACDIAHVPLKAEALDVAIFSLSLMGTNYVDFLLEAHRCMKLKGFLKIAEVRSRFEDVAAFIQMLEGMGFTLLNQDDTNTMFLLFEFQKTSRAVQKKNLPASSVPLKACRYKKR
eukprot:GILK01005514.1.p1 GENE.GILK01005514.1~~GILK01005514.1.p1  ORF type:complete len:295 (+),score=58.24 GILK01005514.1:37-921(+)